MQDTLAAVPHSELTTRTSPLQPSRSSNSATPVPSSKYSRSSPSPSRPALKKHPGVGPSATTAPPAPLFAVATPTGGFAIPPSTCHSPGYSNSQSGETSWKRFSGGPDWAGSRALDEDLELDSDDDESTSSGTRRTSTSSASSDPEPNTKPVVHSSLVPTAKPFVYAPKPPPPPSGTRRVFSAPESAYPSPVSEPYTPSLNAHCELHPDASPWTPRPTPGPRFQQQQPTPWPTTRPQVFPPTPPYHSPELLSRSYFSAERSPSSAQLAAYFGPSPHDSAFPEPDEDALYLLARQTFVQQSLLTFPIPSLANPAAMMQHFDRAMASANPLACLYGIGLEQAERLLDDPERSGVGEPVLALVRLKRERRMEVCGPSANNRKLGLYKTELCRSWEEKGNCRYGTKCQFAHGKQEVREVPRHPKFKSEVCRTFWLNGSCPYGRRCCFIHATLPGDGTSPSHSAPELLGPIPLESPSDSAPPPASRLALRMSSSSSSSSASSNGPFGPALATYLGPSPAPASDSLFGVSFDQPSSTHLGLGIKLPGRFTNNPTEVPPTFQDPPQSRLARLAALPSHRRTSSSTSSATSDFLQRHDSSSSLSSLTGVGSEWLGSSSSASLDWSAPPAADEYISHRLSEFRIH